MYALAEREQVTGQPDEQGAGAMRESTWMEADQLGNEAKAVAGAVGGVVERPDGLWFEVEDLSGLGVFMMLLTSDRDHWLFINSDGTLSCGRRNPDHALLPYYTQDKLRDMGGSSGSYSGLRVRGEGGAEYLWEPFQGEAGPGSGVVRRLRKHELGNALELEEEQLELGLLWRLSYRTSAKYGIVRQVTVENRGRRVVEAQWLDGLRNVLCPGLEARFQNEFSCLGDAYKQGELCEETGVGIFSLSSVPTDLALPMEALRANVVWAVGGNELVRGLSDAAVGQFRRRGFWVDCAAVRGQRLAYLCWKQLVLEAGENCGHTICADVDYSRLEVERLIAELESGALSVDAVEQDCRKGGQRLRRMVEQADGWQLGADLRRRMRHRSNTIFNLMRGGALPDGYRLPQEDLLATVKRFNRAAAEELRRDFDMNGEMDLSRIWSEDGAFSVDLRRLLREYLPLTFSRRHGDPSRPWNRFSIELEDSAGKPRYAYQGNWRDIFQNWEALLQSYPLFLPAAINRFLNASSADGYNPYRLTKDGFEWEVPNPEDPWSNIGYWGDHQIIYLLRLLELAEHSRPGWWRGELSAGNYVYADIPYRVADFDRMRQDPRATIDYDEERAAAVARRVAQCGEDGKLLTHGEDLVRVGLLEKLLVPALAKLSAFVPGGGIWMNTQRPEWNDANNALVGFGVSVVTAGHLLRYVRFLQQLLAHESQPQAVALSEPVALWLQGQLEVLSKEAVVDCDKERQALLEALARQGDSYRERLYSGGFGHGKVAVGRDRLEQWLAAAQRQLTATLLANRREDGLFHSYNLLKFTGEGVGLRYLSLMLEGQVSILSSGLLTPEQCLQLCIALRGSTLYREDQHSYLLYPDRQLPKFRKKNRIDAAALKRCGPWYRLAQSGQTRLLEWDSAAGGAAFNADLHNARELRERLAREHPELPAAEQEALVELFEDTFAHHAFTGRSGTFFAYEGLGSIYWHMVSKLALAVLEQADSAQAAGQAALARELFKAYTDIRAGLGVEKPVWQHGAIPTDAYSHTPKQAGAQQPGMTGQVKEDLLARRLELGVGFVQGCVRFGDHFVDWQREAVAAPVAVDFIGLDGQKQPLALQPGEFAFSLCQVPVIYRKSGSALSQLLIFTSDGGCTECAGTVLPREWTRELFNRNSRIRRIELNFGGSVATAATAP